MPDTIPPAPIPPGPIVPEPTSGLVNAISIKLPEFWTKMPAIWFIQIESQFSTRNITSEQTKFHYVVQALPQDVAASVYDILIKESNTPYANLKKTLIDRHSMSESNRIEALLSGEEMGDRKPSEFYRRLQTLAGQSVIVTESLILELWRRCLPALVQASIKSSSETKIEGLLKMADEIYEVYQQQNSSLNISLQSERTINELTSANNNLQNPGQTPENLKQPCAGSIRDSTVINAANDSNSQGVQSRIFIKDPISNLTFLIDSGSDVSAIPPSKVTKTSQKKPDQIISAANGSKIEVFGTKYLKTTLGFRKVFNHTFIIASVTKPIIGADFLKQTGLIVDIKNSRLIDPLTKSSVTGTPCRQNVASTRFFAIEAQYNSILKEFASLMQPPDFTLPVKHSVVHHILTKGPLPNSQPRRLNNVKFKIAKEEFEYMVQIGICRPSSSPCASPLHMAAKHEANDWRPCGDYRRLNAATIPDRNPLPHIHDCNANLHQRSYN
ncbi:uncharacterized protein LOC129905419 [Episyrphus balteatus]|uniref:uncharacterized protein LOC129905419 n=1 Tax=Episyrphus balteatus TaxID=286459 RepID=UPI002485ED3F|nr:uncharacterized protein LOC129905419 [Episyrphus balteatus]